MIGSDDAAADHERRTLERIAEILGLSIRFFLDAASRECSERAFRTPGDQTAALLRAFDRIADPATREGIIALVEAEAEAASHPVD